MFRLQILGSFLFTLFSTALAQDARSLYIEATTALKNQSYGQYYVSIQKAYVLNPTNQNILWHMGMASALNNKGRSRSIIRNSAPVLSR